MRLLKEDEEKIAINFIREAVVISNEANCLRSKCGAVIVKDGEIIGKGFNSPSGNLESQRRCNMQKDKYDFKVTDKTCCVHAEHRAIMDAIKNNSDKIIGSTIYFIRNKEGQVLRAGKPYCTHCSKMALDAGIKEFVLWHDEGVTVYDTEEYNLLSYEYMGQIN
jgi:deoxycytidylate deaminase